MSTKSLEAVNIHEQRRFLDKLDEEIEKAITELDSLNSYTMNQANKKVQKKPPVHRFHTPNRSSSTNAHASPNISIEEPVESQSANPAIKIINQEGLQQQPSVDINANENKVKEIGYNSIESNAQTAQKENINQSEDASAQKKSALPANFWVTISEKRKQKSQGTEKKEGNSIADFLQVSRDSTSCGTKDTLNASSQKPLMEYHKLSNLDIPKEIIHGNAKPEHFFGFQQNLRKQNANGQQRSPKSAQVNQVVDRLLQYGRDKEERLKAIMEAGDHSMMKKLTYAKNKNKPLTGRNDEQSYFYEEEDSQVNSEVVDENAGVPVANQNNQPTFAKKVSIKPSEITPSQMNQALGAQYESKSSSATLKDPSDPFYQLYKEGKKNAKSLQHVYSLDNKVRSGEIQEKSLTPSKKQSAASLSNAGKCQDNEQQYVSGSEQNKWPSTKDLEGDRPGFGFRPQLSKKSLEIAAKLGNSFQRLVDTSINKANENKKKLLKELDSNLTFKPKINKLSAQLDEKFKATVFNGDDLHRWDQLYLMKDKYNIDKEIKKLERERIEKENDECTFHPKLNTISASMYRDKSVSFADRVFAWREMKDRKLNRERSAILEKEVEECTFVPATLSPVKLGSSRSAINLHDMSQTSIRGLDNHFEKIDKANRMKRELEARQDKFTGKCWKRQITVPKEFQLTKKTGSLSPFSRNRSMANLDISTEEKIFRNTVFLEDTRYVSPQALRTRGTCNESWMDRTLEHSLAYDNFGNTIVKLHYELQKMEI